MEFWYIQCNSSSVSSPPSVYSGMAKLGMVDIALELLKEMSNQSNQKQWYNTDAMQQVSEHMDLKP
jgi:pentatricopeptide repeat protein